MGAVCCAIAGQGRGCLRCQMHQASECSGRGGAVALPAAAALRALIACTSGSYAARRLPLLTLLLYCLYCLPACRYIQAETPWRKAQDRLAGRCCAGLCCGCGCSLHLPRCHVRRAAGHVTGLNVMLYCLPVLPARTTGEPEYDALEKLDRLEVFEEYIRWAG